MLLVRLKTIEEILASNDGFKRVTVEEGLNGVASYGLTYNDDSSIYINTTMIGHCNNEAIVAVTERSWLNRCCQCDFPDGNNFTVHEEMVSEAI